MYKIGVFFKIILASLIAFFTAAGGMFGMAAPENNVSMMAHRGYSHKYPENTALAFEQAAKHGAEGVETDLRVTKDGVYVLSHDDSVELSDGSVLSVADNTFADLTAKPLKNKKTKDEVYLCSYSEFLAVMKEYGLEFYIEFKVLCTEELACAVFSEAAEEYDISKCIFESPRFDDVLLVRGLFPDMPVMFVIGDRETDYKRCVGNGISADIQYYALTEEIVAEFHENGLKVGAWTCDNRFCLEYAKSLGVDYIESNVFCES